MRTSGEEHLEGPKLVRVRASVPRKHGNVRFWRFEHAHRISPRLKKSRQGPNFGRLVGGNPLQESS